MLWDVTVRMDGTSDTFESLEDIRYHGAKAKAVKLFIDKHGLPGRPYEYIAGIRRGVLEISVKAQEDLRTIPRLD